MDLTEQQISEYRLEWKLELMRKFYNEGDGRDLNTARDVDFQRWLRMKFATMK